jgi:Protein of unknown function (DUF1592)/Protein of unknown function (DUF1588)/Protein of unknown function (DUF1595)/Protein of unknown function (DUF1585)/Protein of unknown function (DUF1587)
MRAYRQTARVTACLAAGMLSLVGCSESVPPPVAAAYEHAPDRVRRMTQEQYANTIHYIFGRDIDVGTPFAPLRRTDGLLASSAATAGVTGGELQQLQRTASSIAAQVLDKGSIEHKTPSRREFLVPCKPADPTAADDACAKKFIQPTARLIYRRPLSDQQINTWIAMANRSAAGLHDFYAGLDLVIEGMLIDPKFLMIVDETEPDSRHPGKHRLDAYSLASKLSFFLWNSGPDDALLEAASNGELSTNTGLTRVVDTMLASPRMEAGVRAFFDDMFGFDDFDTLAKDSSVYPSFTGTTVTDAREQTLRTVVDQLLTKKGDYRDLYTTRSTFISPALAAIYNVPAPPGWTPYEFPPDSPRSGMLTQISFLAVHSHPARSSPTRRGRALRELLLCENVPTPPPNVDFSALNNPDAHYRTQRERVAVHLKNATCAGCHKITDPMGLALESFDGSGQFRETENGAKIDTSGNLDGKTFTDVIGLAKVLHDSPALTSCFVSRMYSYGSGGPATKSERPLLPYLNQRFAQDGYRVPDLMRTIALGFAYPRGGAGISHSPEVKQAANTPPTLSNPGS